MQYSHHLHFFRHCSEYKNLHEHFRESHYLCEIDQCASVQWSNAFRSELDLKIHIAKEHSKGLSKTQAKQLRNFDLGFSYSPHPSQVANSRGRGGRRGGREGHEFSRGRYGGREGRGGRGARSHNDRLPHRLTVVVVVVVVSSSSLLLLFRMFLLTNAFN